MIHRFDPTRARAAKRQTPTKQAATDPRRRTRTEKLAALEAVYQDGVIPIDAMIDLLLFRHQLASGE